MNLKEKELQCIDQQSCIESPALIVGGSKGIFIEPIDGPSSGFRQLLSEERVWVIRPGGRFRITIKGVPEATTNFDSRTVHVYPIKTSDVSKPVSKTAKASAL